MIELETCRERLITFANGLGYEVELDSPMEDQKQRQHDKLAEYLKEGQITQEQYDELITQECRPSGDCHYLKRVIRIREGKGLKGQVSTLIHELTHAIALGGLSYYTWPGEQYYELAAESVTQFVTQAIGLDRTKQTSKRIFNYGFGDYLISPVTVTISKIILDELGVTND